MHISAECEQCGQTDTAGLRDISDWEGHSASGWRAPQILLRFRLRQHGLGRILHFDIRILPFSEINRAFL